MLGVNIRLAERDYSEILQTAMMPLTVPVIGELLKHGARLARLHVDHHLFVLVLGVHLLKGVLQVFSMELLHNNKRRLHHTCYTLHNNRRKLHYRTEYSAHKNIAS